MIGIQQILPNALGKTGYHGNIVHKIIIYLLFKNIN